MAACPANIDLANFNWGAFDLIVIDESHNFRNSGGSRYERLLNDIIKDGARTKVLMLSATPVNTSLIDLRNQVYLMTEKSESLFRDSLGVRNVGTVMAVAQRVFRAWEDEQRNKSRNGRIRQGSTPRKARAGLLPATGRGLHFTFAGGR